MRETEDSFVFILPYLSGHRRWRFHSASMNKNNLVKNVSFCYIFIKNVEGSYYYYFLILVTSKG